VKLTLDIRAVIRPSLPQLATMPGRKHRAHRVRAMSKILCAAYEQRRLHACDPSAVSLSRDYVTKALRVGKNKGAHIELLREFFEFPEGNRGYSRDRKQTKAYRLRSEVRDALHEVYCAAEPLPVLIEDDDGNEIVVPLPDNGSPVESLCIPPILPVSVDAVNKAIATVERWITETAPTWPLDPQKPSKSTLDDALRFLYACRKWIVSVGGLPNLYTRQRNGRLGPSGFHVISLPARVRHLLFAESGLWDYDLNSCHWRIFSSVAASMGIDTPHVHDYIDDREGWMDHWALRGGHWITSDYKAVASSWFTGGTLSASLWTESARLVGPMS
jgi:hypothetical protein